MLTSTKKVILHVFLTKQHTKHTFLYKKNYVPNT